MPIVQKGIAAFSDHMPKVISPSAHAIADYAIAGAFGVLGALLWKGKRRAAAIASLTFAGASVANAVLADYPGGLSDKIGFSTHTRLDLGIAGLASSVPGMLGVSGEPEAKFLGAIGIALTVIAVATDVEAAGGSRPFLRKSA